MSKYLIAFFLFLGFSTSVLAQRVSYPQLVMQTDRPEIFIDDIILPGDNGQTTLAFIFRFNNDFIPFKKVPANHSMDIPADAEFYSTIRLNSEIFEGKLKRRDDNTTNSVSRDHWTDTLFTTSFEHTQSDEYFASGALSTQLKPGNYHYILQLAMMQEINERNTQKRNIQIPDLYQKDTGEIMLISKEIEFDDGPAYQLMNMNNNIPFGENFYALIRIPNYQSSAAYTINVRETTITSKDTTQGANIYTSDLTGNSIFENSTITLEKKKTPFILIKEGQGDLTYALVEVPAEQFENAIYSLSIMKSGSEKPVAKKVFRSYWPDMPASLYNLDIAIEHLRYILSEKEIERIRRGNRSEREQKFREFWETRDPSPNTVYNELMAEYYRRIDYAFKEFGSQQNPMGHENDQGEVYIKFGPPSEKERIFPPEGKTREIWKYPNREFVFEATTGFGDYVLIGTR